MGLPETRVNAWRKRGTPATKISRACHNWLIKTSKATIIAGAVLLAASLAPPVYPDHLVANGDWTVLMGWTSPDCR